MRRKKMVWSNNMWMRLKRVSKNIEIQFRHHIIFILFTFNDKIYFSQSAWLVCLPCINLDDIIEELMEDMDDSEASNHENSDIEAEDMWEPESLQKDYNENADDDITTRKQYGKNPLLDNQCIAYFKKLLFSLE